MTWLMMSSVTFILMTLYVVIGLRRGWHVPGDPSEILFRKVTSLSPSRAIGYAVWIIGFSILWPFGIAFISVVALTLPSIAFLNRLYNSVSKSSGLINKFGVLLARVLAGKSEG